MEKDAYFVLILLPFIFNFVLCSQLPLNNSSESSINSNSSIINDDKLTSKQASNKTSTRYDSPSYINNGKHEVCLIKPYITHAEAEFVSKYKKYYTFNLRANLNNEMKLHFEGLVLDRYLIPHWMKKRFDRGKVVLHKQASLFISNSSDATRQQLVILPYRNQFDMATRITVDEYIKQIKSIAQQYSKLEGNSTHNQQFFCYPEHNNTLGECCPLYPYNVDVKINTEEDSDVYHIFYYKFFRCQFLLRNGIAKFAYVHYEPRNYVGIITAATYEPKSKILFEFDADGFLHFSWYWTEMAGIPATSSYPIIGQDIVGNPKSRGPIEQEYYQKYSLHLDSPIVKYTQNCSSSIKQSFDGNATRQDVLNELPIAAITRIKDKYYASAKRRHNREFSRKLYYTEFLFRINIPKKANEKVSIFPTDFPILDELAKTYPNDWAKGPGENLIESITTLGNDTTDFVSVNSKPWFIGEFFDKPNDPQWAWVLSCIKGKCLVQWINSWKKNYHGVGGVEPICIRPTDIAYIPKCKIILAAHDRVYRFIRLNELPNLCNLNGTLHIFGTEIFNYTLNALHFEDDKFFFFVKQQTVISIKTNFSSCDTLERDGLSFDITSRTEYHQRQFFEQKCNSESYFSEGNYNIMRNSELGIKEVGDWHNNELACPKRSIPNIFYIIGGVLILVSILLFIILAVVLAIFCRNGRQRQVIFSESSQANQSLYNSDSKIDSSTQPNRSKSPILSSKKDKQPSSRIESDASPQPVTSTNSVLPTMKLSNSSNIKPSNVSSAKTKVTIVSGIGKSYSNKDKKQGKTLNTGSSSTSSSISSSSGKKKAEKKKQKKKKHKKNKIK